MSTDKPEEMPQVQVLDVRVRLPFRDFNGFKEFVRQNTEMPAGQEFRRRPSFIPVVDTLWKDIESSAREAGLTSGEFVSILVYFGSVKLVEIGRLQAASPGN